MDRKEQVKRQLAEMKRRLHASDEDRAIRESLRAEMKRRGLDEVKTRDCPECYGTGFRFGFGMPCSKGCTPRKETVNA